MQEIFELNKSEKLSGAMIWTPMLLADNLDFAKERENKFLDSRLKQYVQNLLERTAF